MAELKRDTHVYAVPVQVPATAGHWHPVWAVQLGSVKWLEQEYEVPRHEPIDVAFHAQPDSASHVVCAPFEVHGSAVPLHDPITVSSHMQPGVLVHVVDAVAVEQAVVVGVPMQRGPVEKITVDDGARMRADLQQISLVQSLLCLQVLGHEVLQIPLQQTSPFIVLQSVDCAQALGQGVAVGFRQSPSTARFGSSRCADVQQISLLSVLQSAEPVQALGHSPGGKQIGSL